jgi:hypothetical protein
MSPYGFNIQLPFIGKKIRIKEITAKEHRTLVKSTYNDDLKDFIFYLNSLLSDLVQDDNFKHLTVMDAFLVLVATRAISISPDLKLKMECPKTKIQFEHSVGLDALIRSIESFKFEKGVYKDNWIEIEYSSLKMKDAEYFYRIEDEFMDNYTLASSIDVVKMGGQTINFSDISFTKLVHLLISVNFPTK